MRVSATPPELWGGVECTLNRVRNTYFDQSVLTRHEIRDGDIDRIAALGIRTLRYPVLWERVAQTPAIDDWSWTDARLEALRAAGIRPIVGLVHHGSGPRWTSLTDDSFADGLAAFACRVAERYPWLDAYTIVNEPLTTARFSGLYGFWYPHKTNVRSFARALINQCKATVLAMAAIRRVNGSAQLIQTEDICRVFSRPSLAEEAAFLNERRWLTFDLLCSRVVPGHPMWAYLRAHGVSESELAWFAQNAAPPDIIGLNYYATSDRFIDDRLDLYPPGSQGDKTYVDAEAVRVQGCGQVGHAGHLRDTWQRYELPIAFTEVHLGCTREEQLRWLRDAWDATAESRKSGIDARAVTAWALFGSVDWDTLVTRSQGHYEPGVFDVRGDQCRPTALADAVRELVAGQSITHPAAAGHGWWISTQPATFGDAPAIRSLERHTRPPLLITGATGTLGRALSRVCTIRGLAHRTLRRQEMDIADAASVQRMVEQVRPWAIINASGYVRVDDAETDRERCWRENVEGPEILAAAAARRDIPLLTFSSDLVFDGNTDRPYVESDRMSPLSVYGESKAAAEKKVLEVCPRSLIVRTAAFFGPWDSYNFLTLALKSLASGRSFTAAGDAVVSPTYVPDLVSACLDLLIDGEAGVWHLVNGGAITWADFGRVAAARFGLEPGLIEARPLSEMGLRGARPRYSALATERSLVMPSLEAAIDRFVLEVEHLPNRAA
jgi:dTDP-4-dehydrorhamnose reductase